MRLPPLGRSTIAGHVENRNGAAEATKLEIADFPAGHDLLDPPQHPRRDQNLAGIGLPAQPGGQVGDAADRRVVETAFVADAAQRGESLGDPDPEAEFVPDPAPPFGQLPYGVPHRQRHLDRPPGRLLDRDRVVEEDHQAVAGEALQRAPEVEDQLGPGRRDTPRARP